MPPSSKSAAGGKASHGAVVRHLEPHTHDRGCHGRVRGAATVTVEIANLTASSVSSTGDNRFAADLTKFDFEISMDGSSSRGARFTRCRCLKDGRIEPHGTYGCIIVARRVPVLDRAGRDPFRVIGYGAHQISAKIDASKAIPEAVNLFKLTLEGIKDGKIATWRGTKRRS
jgi:hypothetical protein